MRDAGGGGRDKGWRGVREGAIERLMCSSRIGQHFIDLREEPGWFAGPVVVKHIAAPRRACFGAKISASYVDDFAARLFHQREINRISSSRERPRYVFLSCLSINSLQSYANIVWV